LRLGDWGLGRRTERRATKFRTDSTTYFDVAFVIAEDWIVCREESLEDGIFGIVHGMDIWLGCFGMRRLELSSDT